MFITVWLHLLYIEKPEKKGKKILSNIQWFLLKFCSWFTTLEYKVKLWKNLWKLFVLNKSPVTNSSYISCDQLFMNNLVLQVPVLYPRYLLSTLLCIGYQHRSPFPKKVACENRVPIPIYMEIFLRTFFVILCRNWAYGPHLKYFIRYISLFCI